MFALLISVIASPLLASEIEAGKELAQRLCARCHAVVPGEERPAKDAPPFASFGVDWPVSDLQEALAEGILVGHSQPQMPEITLAPDEITAFIAYLESISGQP